MFTRLFTLFFFPFKCESRSARRSAECARFEYRPLGAHCSRARAAVTFRGSVCRSQQRAKVVLLVCPFNLSFTSDRINCIVSLITFKKFVLSVYPVTRVSRNISHCYAQLTPQHYTLFRLTVRASLLCVCVVYVYIFMCNVFCVVCTWDVTRACDISDDAGVQWEIFGFWGSLSDRLWAKVLKYSRLCVC